MIRAYYFALSSGILSGSLHAITGPDHFTAVLPVILNNRWWKSGCYGGCWGFGHGVCSALVGFVGFFMKEYLLQSLNVLVQFRFLSDLMIGVTLVTISVMGLLEATEEDEETEGDEETADVAIVRSPSSPRALIEQLSGKNDDSNSSSSFASSVSASSSSGKNESIKSSFFRRGIVMSTLLLNGFIMGLSWDGLPSLAPTMLLNFEQVIVFLGSYLLSTAFIMAVVSGMIGESSSFLSSSLSQKSEGGETSTEETSEHFANRFALLTSFTAGVIGFLWLLVGTGKGIHYLLSFLAMETILLPPQNDGLVVVNDGLAHQKHQNFEEISSVDFTVNMIISSLSIVLMVSSLIMGIFYPSSRLEERIRVIAVKCHSRYNFFRDCFQRRIPEAISPVPIKSLKVKSKD
jgi:hypothetical protein